MPEFEPGVRSVLLGGAIEVRFRLGDQILSDSVMGNVYSLFAESWDRNEE